MLTHLHFDHAGGLALLPSSVPIVVQRREWDGGHDAAAIAKNFSLPVDYEAASQQITLIDGDHDLLGDGSIQLLLTPGHTPGHQSVRVGERLVLGGDVVHFASGLDDHRFPIFGDDFVAQASSANRLRALRDAGAVVLPGHDPAVLSRVPWRCDLKTAGPNPPRSGRWPPMLACVAGTRRPLAPARERRPDRNQPDD